VCVREGTIDTIDTRCPWTGTEWRVGRATRSWIRASVIALIIPLLVVPAPAAEIDIDSDPPGQRFRLLPPGERLAVQDTVTTPSVEVAEPPPVPERRPNWLLTSIASGGAMVGASLNALTERTHVGFNFGNEGWFGANTRYGGADKASHFVSYYIVSKEFQKLFVVLGHKPENARWLAAGLAA
jgi:hypothetical protein